MATEKRFVTHATELRAESQGEEFVITGYAALFNSPSKNLGGFVETIAPGAFTRTLAEKPVVRFTFNHSMDDVLARTDNGTLALKTDSKGLKFRAQLNPKITRHADLWEACRSGLYNECSFAFTVPDGGQTWSPDGTQRTLLDVDLADCALVGVPAYEGTSAAARNAGVADATVEQKRQWLANQQADWKRKDKAHEIGMAVLRDLKIAPEKRGNDDWFADRAAEMCSAMGLDYCDHDNDYIFAADPDDDSEENCYRFDYECGDDGKPEIDEDSRTAVKHDLAHSERGRKVLAERRQRKADAELRQHMRKLAGIHSGI